MGEPNFGEWHDMASAPKDGSRILVAVRGSEQGPAEVDVARWARPEKSAEESWIAVDSDPACVIVYAEAELSGWMPLPTPVPKLRSARAARSLGSARTGFDEIGGSGI